MNLNLNETALRFHYCMRQPPWKSKLPGCRGVSPGQHMLSPRTDRESSGKVPGVLDARRALADGPERRRVELPRPPDEESRMNEPLTNVHDRSRPLVLHLTDGRASRGGRCFKYRPPRCLFRSPSAPGPRVVHLRCTPGPPPLPSRSPSP